MFDLSDFKKGLKVMVDGAPFVVTDFQHVKPGKGNQFTRTKLKNLLTGANLERTFKSGEKFEEPDVVYVEMQFLYKDENGWHFMNQENYEQMQLSDEVVAEQKNFLIENVQAKVCLYNGRAVGLELPTSVILTVTQTDPGFKGNTVTGATKPATLETGHVVFVPTHISEGDRLKVDTRTGEYSERVAKE